MTNDQVQPRILVIDNEERVREDLHAMFTPLGYDVRVATGSGPALQENAKSLAGKFRPHVAIVDMRLLLDDDPNDRSGVQLLEELEPAHCILYSAYITPEISRKLADFRTAGWTGKEEPPQMLVDLVNRVARESSATQKNFQIEKNSVIFEQESRALLGRDTEIPSSLIEDILCQVFHDANGVKVEKITGAVKTPMSVNRERSLILKTARRDKLEPFIVKIAKKKNILQESKNYQEYIEGNLKGRFYANLIGRPISFWDLGALVYTFLGSSEQNVVFSAFYQREEDENKILKPLQAFWGEVWRGLYEKTKDIETSLYSSYNESLKLEERLTKFPDQTEHRAYRGIDINMPNPITWVLRHKTDNSVLNARQAITHGDLHGDNIFVDDSHAWVIDFERSGWGHILRDFTELEVDILTRLAWKKDDKDLKEFFRLLTYLADPYYFGKDFESIGQFNNKELRKAFNVIKGLRALAKDITKFNDFREYSWSLLFDTIFVATHTEEEEHQQERALLYGSVLCSCLQHWGLKWPPTNWLSLTNNQANQLNKLDMPKKGDQTRIS